MPNVDTGSGGRTTQFKMSQAPQVSKSLEEGFDVIQFVGDIIKVNRERDNQVALSKLPEIS